MHISRAAAGRLASSEVTGWLAYLQVKDWIDKAEKEDPHQALAFARAVNEMTTEAERMRRRRNG